MSFEQSLSSKKVTLQPGGSTSSLLKSPTTPTSSSNEPPSPKSSPSRLSLKALGRSSTSATGKSSRSPIKRQKTVISGQEAHKGTSSVASVDHSPYSDSGKQSTPNKIIHSWKSACRDKTKDLIRRWKTLPESHPDFDQIGSGGSAAAAAGSNSTCCGSPIERSSSPCSSSTTNIPESHANNGVDMVNPSHPSSSGGGTGGRLGKNLGSSKKGGGVELNDGFQALSIGKSGSVCYNSGNGPLVQDDSSKTTSTGWSVHVWATYVQRGMDDVGIEENKPPGRDFLSDFQKVKLTHFFRHVLDMNHDDVISAEDFVALNQRIRHYIEWSSECIEFHILKEVHSGFLECFLNQPLDDSSVMYYCNAERETRHHVNIDEWLDVWGALLNPAKTLEALPLWLQYFPKILFQVINKSGSGTISKEELRAFYTMFLGIDFRVVNDTLDSIYNAMTDNGRNKIAYTLFKLCFTNFLLGKFPHGPGQFLFGICAPNALACPFPIDYSALNTPKDDLEPYDPDKDKGQSNRRLESDL